MATKKIRFTEKVSREEPTVCGEYVAEVESLSEFIDELEMNYMHVGKPYKTEDGYHVTVYCC